MEKHLKEILAKWGIEEPVSDETLIHKMVGNRLIHITYGGLLRIFNEAYDLTVEENAKK